MDNAIEAAAESESKNLSLGVLPEADHISFIFANSFAVLPNLSRLFSKEYTTKGENHGLGLYIVKELLDTQYPKATLETILDQDLFIQELCVPKTMMQVQDYSNIHVTMLPF